MYIRPAEQLSMEFKLSEKEGGIITIFFFLQGWRVVFFYLDEVSRSPGNVGFSI